MFETYTTIMGRVIAEPRRFQTAHGEGVSFRVACNARRLDHDTQQWVNISTLYLDVTCWQKLAAATVGQVYNGSSIIAHGSLKTNEYVGSDGVKRSNLELRASSLGLDLSAGRTVRDGDGPDEPSSSTRPAGDEPERLGTVSEDEMTAA